MKKVLLSMAVVMLLSSVFMSSCKKGEDDPFLSLKSRNGRVIGTWELKNKEYTSTTSTTTNSTNSINSDKSSSVNSSSTKNTFDGTTRTQISDGNYTNSSTSTSYDWTNNNFPTTTNEYSGSNKTTDTYTYSVELEIREDYTYTATYTETDKYHSESNSSTSGGTTYSTETDTTYSPANTRTWTDEGEWFWLDSNEDKIIIQAGPMQGTVKRLANKEIVIEEVSNETDNSTEYTPDYFYTNNDVNDPYKESKGNETEVSNTTQAYSNTQTWEAK